MFNRVRIRVSTRVTLRVCLEVLHQAQGMQDKGRGTPSPHAPGKAWCVYRFRFHDRVHIPGDPGFYVPHEPSRTVCRGDTLIPQVGDLYNKIIIVNLVNPVNL